ncbi:MAG: penicillin-binding protein, partial [Nocardioides sp.]
MKILGGMTMDPRRRRQGSVLLSGAVVLAGSLSACTSDDGEPPSVVADALVSGLNKGKLDTALFDGESGRAPQRAWREALGGLGDARAEVSAGEIAEGPEGETATVPLTYTWDLPQTDEPWTARARARLVRIEPEEGEPTWKVRLEPGLFGLEAREQLVLRTTLPDRAPILGADGAEIVTDRPVVRFGVDKTRAAEGDQEELARTLAQVVDVDADALVERVEEAGEKAFVEAIVLRADESQGPLRAIGGIEGLSSIADTLPLAPTREFARPLLGTVGAVTLEIVEESEGVYAPGDEAGLSGLQARYDEQLRGTPGVRVVAVKGDDERTMFRSEAAPGTPLVTTLD